MGANKYSSQLRLGSARLRLEEKEVTNITEQITKETIPTNIRNMTYSFTRFLLFSKIPKLASRERGKSTNEMICDEIKIKQMTLNTGEIFSSFFRIRTMLEMIKNMPKVMEMEIMEMSRILSLFCFSVSVLYSVE